MPAFVVMSDATLESVATALPGSRAELLRVVGIGARKADAYGDALLALVRGEGVASADEPA